MKNIFLPSEQNPNVLSHKLNYDAQKACDNAAIKVEDLIERSKEEFRIEFADKKSQQKQKEVMNNEQMI